MKKCKNLYVKQVEEERILYKCMIQHDFANYYTIKQVFETLHANHRCPNNEECCFAYTDDCESCPFFNKN